MVPDSRSPDHSVCRHCGVPISWDDYSYTHDDTGFADCGVVISGGEKLGGGITLNPDMRVAKEWEGFRAEPVEWNES